MDYEISAEKNFIKSYDNLKKIRLLVIGDYETGKTSLFRSICKTKTEKEVKNTCGCEIHSIKTQISYNVYTGNSNDLFKDQYLIEFWDVSGDRYQRPFLNFYLKNEMKSYKGILFIFDVNSLRTLSSFFVWLKDIFENKILNIDYNYLWQIPFFFIGNKTDLLSKKNLEKKKKEILLFVKNMFNCNDGENVIFLNKNFNENEFNYCFLKLFINQLCIENELITSENGNSTNSEYLINKRELLLTKKTNKYTLNGNLFSNKIKLQYYDKTYFSYLFKYLWLYSLEMISSLKKYISKIYKRKNNYDKLPI